MSSIRHHFITLSPEQGELGTRKCRGPEVRGHGPVEQLPLRLPVGDFLGAQAEGRKGEEEEERRGPHRGNLFRPAEVRGWKQRQWWPG